jgi:hypothetical protein
MALTGVSVVTIMRSIALSGASRTGGRICHGASCHWLCGGWTRGKDCNTGHDADPVGRDMKDIVRSTSLRPTSTPQLMGYLDTRGRLRSPKPEKEDYLQHGSKTSSPV